MRKCLSSLIIFFSSVLYTVTGNTQNVFVWDGNINNHTGLEWKTYLENQGYTVTYPAVDSVLPSDYSMYDAIFLHFGFWNPGYHGITEFEAQNIYNYGLNGGKIYIEGGDINGWPGTNPGYLIVRQICGLSGADDGGSITVNATTPMSGMTSTLTHSMSFQGYTGINSYLDFLYPDSSTGIFYNNGNCHGISWDNGTYRVVCLSFELAGLTSDTTGVSHKDSLMGRILEFLLPPPTYIPRKVKASAGVEQITLTWSIPELTAGFQRYRIYGDTVPNPAVQMDSTAVPGNVSDTSKIYTGLMPGTRYYFRITTLHDGGESGFSDEVSAKPFTAPQGIVVTTTADTGTGSLRWAILEANNQPGIDTISFEPSLMNQILYLESGLPPITGQTFINGDVDDNAEPDIELDGSLLYSSDIFTIRSGFNILKGLVISGSHATSGAGIKMTDTSSHDNLIIGNYIGLRQDGSTVNANLHGIFITGGAYSNYIGDGTVQGRNVISGNQSANLYLSGTYGNVIRGNYFGLSTEGSGIAPVVYDESCIYLNNSHHNQIGGSGPGDRNIISGSMAYGTYVYYSENNSIINNWFGFDAFGNAHRNQYGGIVIQELSHNSVIGLNKIGNNRYEGSYGITVSNADSILIYGNYVGTTPDGTAQAGNDGGITIYYSHYIQVGGTGDSARNIISGNYGPGIDIYNSSDIRILNNYIGTDVNGTAAIHNESNGISITDDSRMIAVGNGEESGRNVISGNSGSGLRFNNSDVSIRNIKVMGNFIGTDFTGTQILPNGNHGIQATGNGAVLRVDSIAFNCIANNGFDGINLDGTGVDSVVMFNNSIFHNTMNGITVTAGAQNNLSPPGLTGASGDTVYGFASGNSEIQVCRDSENEGEFYLGVTVADGNGLWFFQLPAGLPPNTSITALQTQSGLRTSAFSSPFLVNPNHLNVTKTTDDTSIGTLRHAINYANTSPGPDSIMFQLPGSRSIYLSSSLPALIDSFTTVNGDTNSDGIPDIEIKGASMGHGLVIQSSHNQINGLVISGCGTYMGNEAAIQISGTLAYLNRITNCYIGTNPAGTAAAANGNGIMILSGAHDNTIGSETSWLENNRSFSGGNVISGNINNGIFVRDTNTVYNIIIGNRIGTDVTGNASIPNERGIQLNMAQFNLIGNGTSGGRNIISGNAYYGIDMYEAHRNTLSGNIIGLDADGQSDLGNGSIGILCYASYNNMIGTGIPEGGNIISGNDGPDGGLALNQSDNNEILGNIIGLDITGAVAIPNSGPGIMIIYGGIGNRIGNGTTNGRNIISGNETGIEFFVEPYLDKEGKESQGNGQRDSRNFRGPMGYISNNVVIGNYIGTDITGTVLIPNDSQGIALMNQGGQLLHNSIGGMTSDSGNVIAGSEYGIYVYNSDSNRILYNSIGTDHLNEADFGNGYGLYLTYHSSSNDVRFNHIAYNSVYGISAHESGTADNTFRYNSIYENGAGIYFINGPQNGILPPVISAIDNADSTLHGYSVPGALVHLYADTSANPQGRIFSGETYADESGIWFLKVPVRTGWTFRALQDSAMNTSEFSNPYLPKLGHLSALPNPLDFGDVITGTAANLEVKVYSPDGLVEISDWSHNSMHFNIDSVRGNYLIQTGDTLLFFISYHPLSVQTDHDTLIVYNSYGESLRLPVRGNAIPPAGNLTVRPFSIHFGERLIGDSLSGSVWMYAADGDVQISLLSLRYGTDFRIRNALTQPFTILNGDSVQISLGFNPQSPGERYDTLLIVNNSPVSQKSVPVQGTGLSNSDPNAFSVKQFNTANLINTRFPVFHWEGKGDPNGDALIYILEVSKTSDFALVAYRDTTADTTQSATTQLDSLGSYYWRVTAQDGWGGSRTSSSGYFRIDAVPAELTAGSFFSTVLKPYLSVNVISSKLMRSVNAGIGLRSPANALLDTTTKAFDLESAQNKFYQTPYKLTSAGKLFLTITGTDSAMNTTTVSRNYSISAIAKETALSVSSDDHDWMITAPKKTVTEDGYLLVSSDKEETKTIRGQSVLTLAKAADQWEAIGKRLNILGSSAIREGHGFMVTMRYDETVTADLQRRYAGYDERNIGLYAEENGAWVYIGGEGKNGQVQSKVKEYGKVQMMYNPEHEFLPVKVELAQNYPNPFNPATTIRFGVPQEGKVKLTVYNVLGQKVKELVNDTRAAGYYSVIWNGRTGNGHAAASGVYLYRIETPQGTAVKKMMFVK